MEIQVIEKTNWRINRVTGTTIKGRLIVCAYCRVSTDNEEQLNSYQSQLKYYDEKINKKLANLIELNLEGKINKEQYTEKFDKDVVECLIDK